MQTVVFIGIHLQIRSADRVNNCRDWHIAALSCDGFYDMQSSCSSRIMKSVTKSSSSFVSRKRNNGTSVLIDDFFVSPVCYHFYFQPYIIFRCWFVAVALLRSMHDNEQGYRRLISRPDLFFKSSQTNIAKKKLQSGSFFVDFSGQFYLLFLNGICLFPSTKQIMKSRCNCNSYYGCDGEFHRRIKGRDIRQVHKLPLILPAGIMVYLNSCCSCHHNRMRPLQYPPL